MIARTSTESAAWTLVEGNDKPYARVKVLRTLCTGPSPMDLWATTHIARVIERMRFGESQPAGAGGHEPDRAAHHPLPADARGPFRARPAGGRPMLQRRSVHRHCVLEGRTVFQAGRRGEAAVAEIDALIAEVFNYG
jgi:chromosome partitioning protein